MCEEDGETVIAMGQTKNRNKWGGGYFPERGEIQ